MQNSTSQNYEVSVQGGNEKTNFNVSVSAMDDKGLLKGDEYKRYTGRVNLDHQLNKIVKVGASISYAYKSNDKRDGGIYGQAQKMTTITHAYQKDGSIYMQPNPWYNAHCSPLLDEDGAYQRNIESTRFFGSAYVQLNPIKGMTLKSQFTLDRSDSRTGTYADYLSRVRYQAGQTSTISSVRSTGTKYVWQNTATYNKEIDKHDFTILLGHEMSHNVSESSSISGEAGAESYKKSAFYDVSKIATPLVSTGYTKTSLLSFFARANYSFDGKYLLQASVRADGSSVLAEGHKWGYFPSVSAGWRISEESFMQDTKSWLDNLKFRVSWGLSGNAAISAYQTLATISSIVPNSTDKAPMTIANPNLTWEKTSALDFGLDFAFLNDWDITLDYFIKNTKDLLLYQQIRPTAGYTQIYTNYGKIQNKGFEFAVGYHKQFTRDFNFSARLTGSTIKNKVKKMGDPLYNTCSGNNGASAYDGSQVGAIDGNGDWNNHSICMEGEAVGSFYGYVTDGIITDEADLAAYKERLKNPEDGTLNDEMTKVDGDHPLAVGDMKFKDINGDGKIDSNDRQILGNGFPALNYGLNLAATYKDWDFNLYMYGVFGQDILSYSAMKMSSMRQLDDQCTPNILTEAYDAAFRNGSGSLPRLSIIDSNRNYRVSDMWVKNGDFLRISNIQVGYTLPKDICNMLSIQKARVYVGVSNLLTISGYNKYGDPECGSGSVLYTGLDTGRYPQPRTFMGGVNITF